MYGFAFAVLKQCEAYGLKGMYWDMLTQHPLFFVVSRCLCDWGAKNGG